jgi:phosphoglycolate phosphatase-like HAD superfamily hydrolase
MHRLVLFDIDCTLIDAHGAGGRALLQAIKDVYGLEGDQGGYTYHGRTDPAIVRDLVAMWSAQDAEQIVAELNGGTLPEEVERLAGRLGADDQTVERLLRPCLDRYVELLRGEVDKGRIELLPGVQELVTVLATDRRVVLGLLTGNVAEGARVKLVPTGLWDLFKVAAFGSDSPLRTDLPAIAVARAKQLTGQRFAGKEIAVIGDTPADITCGAALGVKAVAVATGRHTIAELATHAPDHLFADFSDWRAAYAAILE